MIIVTKYSIFIFIFIFCILVKFHTKKNVGFKSKVYSILYFCSSLISIGEGGSKIIPRMVDALEDFIKET